MAEAKKVTKADLKQIDSIIANYQGAEVGANTPSPRDSAGAWATFLLRQYHASPEVWACFPARCRG